MTLEPLLSASPIIQIHAFTVIPAFFLGVVQLIAPKGTLPHRTIGVIWVALMIAATASSAFIVHPTEPGDPFWARFTVIHIFTVLSAYALITGLLLLLRGGPALKYHSRPFTGLYIGGLMVAGALAFLPGRVMHAVVFGG